MPGYTAAALALFAASFAYVAATWDAHVMNFRVRVLCDEDVPFVNERRDDVAAVGVAGATAARDPQLVRALEGIYPSVMAIAAGAQGVPRYAVEERWPTDVARSRFYGIVRTELTLVDRDTRQVLATASVYRGVDHASQDWRRWRAPIAPRPLLCLPSERVEFIRDVLRPAA